MSLLVIIKQKIPKTLFLNVIGIDGIWVISIVVKDYGLTLINLEPFHSHSCFKIP
jgi:hypothetical protein